MNGLILIVFCVVAAIDGYHHLNEGPLVVTIPWSPIVGKQQQVLGKSIGVFLGLPYAKPPVGELRFRRPVSLDPVIHNHEGFYDASEFKAPCPQPPYARQYNNTSEDCLFLNIWAPAVTGHVDSRSRKPVLFYIYGGGFDKGSVHERRHHGDVLSALSDTVVVSVNHRLNILGFGYGGTESFPGNMGIYDLIKALEWVNQNIEYFGGDPNAVTLFGACSGAMVASGFILSPILQSKLISKVYLASSVMSPHEVTKTPQEMFKVTRAIAQVVGCDNNDQPEATEFTELQIACLRAVDAQVLINSSMAEEVSNLLNWKMSPPFHVIHGTDFLPAPPDHLVLESLPFRRVPILFGNEEAEDEMLLDSWPQSIAEAKDLIKGLIKSNQNVTENQLNTLYEYYFDGVEDKNILQLKRAISTASGDYLHHCPLLLYAEAWTRNGQVIHGYLNEYVMEGFNAKERPLGTKHGDTSFQILGKAYHEYEKFSDNDRWVTRRMIKILSDFSYGRKLAWPPMISDSSRKVLPLKCRFTKSMDPRNVFADPKDAICHLWGEIVGFVVY